MEVFARLAQAIITTLEWWPSMAVRIWKWLTAYSFPVGWLVALGIITVAVTIYAANVARRKRRARAAARVAAQRPHLQIPRQYLPQTRETTS